MPNEVPLQPAYVLHGRPYRETSLLLDVFTQEKGRVSVLAKGVRRPKSRRRAFLQPFFPLLMHCKGKSDLLTLYHVEASQPYCLLAGKQLACGFYLNELLTRLLLHGEAMPALFACYHKTLLAIALEENIQIALRLFEKELLDQLGYGVQLHTDSHGQVILANALYRYTPMIGFIKTEQTEDNLIAGQGILALATGDLSSVAYRRAAKQILRQALAPLLGTKPLKSREMI